VVILEAVISRQGRMEDVRFVEPPDLDLRIAAELRRTLQTWRYRPATRDGQPVAVRMTITAHIRLR
jgi:outer membrane biosynthesis protein TonB